MKKFTVLLLLMVFAFVSESFSQSFFSEIWGNAGFALSNPKLYTIDKAEEEFFYDLNQNSEGVFGLFLGLKANLLAINENFYFGPSIYINKLLPGTALIYIDDPISEDEYRILTNEIKYNLTDLSVNGDFYYKIPKKGSALFSGAGAGIHNVTFKTTFDLADNWDRAGDFEPPITQEDNVIDDSETKVALNLIAKVNLIQNLFLEGRFEFMDGLNQFRIIGTYKLWERKKFEE